MTTRYLALHSAILIGLYSPSYAGNVSSFVDPSPQRQILNSDEDDAQREYIGRGYDTKLGEKKLTSCVTLKSKRKPLAEPHLQHVEHAISLINTSEDFVDQTQMSMSAAYDWGGGSAGASASYFYSSKRSSYRVTALQKTTVTYEDQAYDTSDFELTSAGRKYLMSGGYPQFRYLCGDSFILGWNRGGSFYATVDVDAETSQEQRDIQAAVQASSIEGGASANLTQIYKHKEQTAGLSVTIVRDALSEAIPNPDIPTLSIYSRDFPSKIAILAVKPVAAVKTADYLPIILDANIRDPQGATPEWVNKLADQFQYLTRITQYKADLIYIKDHSTQFIDFNPHPLDQQVSSVSATIERIKGWAINCFRTTGRNCPDQSALNIVVPNYSPTRAEPWQTPYPNVEQDQMIGTTTSEMVLEARGIWQFGDDPRALDPITISTHLRLQNNNTGMSTIHQTLTSQMIPKDYTVYFHFDDIPGNYSDNHVWTPNPGQLRLGATLDEFIAGK